MKKVKRMFAVVLTVCFVQAIVLPAFAIAGTGELKYDPILEEMGISEDAFEAMPLEKKMLYQGFRSIVDSVSDTRYFKETGICGADGTMEYTLVEATKEDYENRTERSLIQPYGNETDTDTVIENWCIMTTTIMKGIKANGRTSYTVKNELDIDIDNMGQSIAILDRTALIAISLNSNMSPVVGSEVFQMDFTHLTGPKAGQHDTEWLWSAQHKSSIGYAFDFCVDNNKRSHKVTMLYEAVSNTSSDVSVADAFGSVCYWKKDVKISNVIFGPSGVEKVEINTKDKCFFAENTHVQLLA